MVRRFSHCPDIEWHGTRSLLGNENNSSRHMFLLGGSISTRGNTIPRQTLPGLEFGINFHVYSTPIPRDPQRGIVDKLDLRNICAMIGHGDRVTTRRRLLAALSIAAAIPYIAFAQRTGTVYRVGILNSLFPADPDVED